MGDYHIEEWRQASLPRPALVRARLATVEASMVLRELGRMGESDLRSAMAALQSVFGKLDQGPLSKSAWERLGDVSNVMLRSVATKHLERLFIDI
jgi:hypothetical protein